MMLTCCFLASVMLTTFTVSVSQSTAEADGNAGGFAGV